MVEEYAVLAKTCYRVGTLLVTRVFRMVCLLGLREGEDILELIVRRR